MPDWKEDWNKKYKEMVEVFGDYMKESRFMEKCERCEEAIREDPDRWGVYLLLFQEWYNLGQHAYEKEQGIGRLFESISLIKNPYVEAAVRLAHDEVRAFAGGRIFDYWERVILPGVAMLQADTLKAKSQGKTLEEWKEERIKVYCTKCVVTEQSVTGKMVLRLDDSTGRVTCSWCGLEYNDESDHILVSYRNYDDHIDSFWTGKLYQDGSFDWVKKV